MPIIKNPLDLLFPDLFFDLEGIVPAGRLLLKLEGYNVTGSIKIKPALFMIDDLECRGILTPHRSTVVESSSGNMGIALALICALRRYDFLCVTDPNIMPAHQRGIEAYGGRVVVVHERDRNAGYLETRLAHIRELLAVNPDYVWLNQYANHNNMWAHADWTAREILNECPRVTRLYVGSGTTGTLTGLARCFGELSPATEIIAVEPEGSVTFDATRAGRRHIPGIGASRRPALADSAQPDRIVYVREDDAVVMCHRLARAHGLLLGGSSGSVLAAIASDASAFNADDVIVAISPDLGDKYLDSVYSLDWVRERFPGIAEALACKVAASPSEPIGEVMARHVPAASPQQAASAPDRFGTTHGLGRGRSV